MTGYSKKAAVSESDESLHQKQNPVRTLILNSRTVRKYISVAEAALSMEFVMVA
jgi:hypothetical protein